MYITSFICLLFTGITCIHMLSRFAQPYLQRFGYISLPPFTSIEGVDGVDDLITSNKPSAKSSIQVLGQEMSLWPPMGVSLPDDDCAFQDTTAPLCLDHIQALGVSFLGQIQGQITCSSSFT